MGTADNSRILHWDACHNVRDLGGLPLAGGGFTPYRSVVRSDNLCRLTPAGQAALLGYGVRTVIDLRSHAEIPLEAHPYLPPHTGAPTYLHVPMSGEDQTRLEQPAALTLADHYCLAIERRRPQVGTILSAIAQAPQGAVLVHCHAGMDRTGIICGLLLALAGVDDTIIAADYALSGRYFREVPEELRAVPDEEERLRRTVQTFSPPEAMLATLAFVRERYGSVEDYALAAEVTSTDLDRLRARLREPSTGLSPPDEDGN